MASYSSQFGISGSSSASSSGAQQTPQSEFSTEVSKAALAVGSYIINWAIIQYANTSALTDQLINNFLAASQQGMDLAAIQLNQYMNTYVPEMNQLANEAATYSSPSRTAYNMGAAGAQAGYAGAAGNQNTLQTLRSYGVDPSSGMYGDILAAQNTATGASEAGAENQAQVNTEATGRTLLQDSIQAGEQMPGDVVNALNSAYQGVAGAENSLLSNANTGATMLNTAAPFYQAATNIKLPGTQSSSVGSSGSISGGQSSNNGNSNSPGTGGGKMGGAGGTYGGTPGYLTGNTPGGNIGNVSPATTSVGPDTATGGAGAPPGLGDLGNPYDSSGGNSTGDTNLTNPDNYGDMGNPFDSSGGDSTGFGQGSSGDSTFSPPSSPGSSPSDQYNPWSQDSGNPYDSSGGNSSGGGDSSGGDNGGGMTNNAGDYSSMGGYGMARGGSVPGGQRGVLPTTGGHVPRQLSPSGGRNTDDIPARLNAGEFVIPKDIAAWKGQEFFQKLIMDSRKKLATAAPAQGQAKPALPGPPRFISRPMQRPQQQMGAR